MTKYLDPKSLGLPARAIVEEIDNATLAYVIRRKSRIIMTDGNKILDRVAMLKNARPGMNIILKTSAPICSKTMKYFKNKGLSVISD